MRVVQEDECMFCRNMLSNEDVTNRNEKQFGCIIILFVLVCNNQGT